MPMETLVINSTQHRYIRVHFSPAVQGKDSALVCSTCRELADKCEAASPITLESDIYMQTDREPGKNARSLATTEETHVDKEELRLTRLSRTLLLVIKNDKTLQVVSRVHVTSSYKYNTESKTMYHSFSTKTNKYTVCDWTYRVSAKVCEDLGLDPHMVWSRQNPVLATLSRVMHSDYSKVMDSSSGLLTADLMQKVKKRQSVRKALGLSRSLFKEALAGNKTILCLALSSLSSDIIERVKHVELASLRRAGLDSPHAGHPFGTIAAQRRRANQVVSHYNANGRLGVRLLMDTLHLASRLGVPLEPDEISPSSIQYTHNRLVAQQQQLRREQDLALIADRAKPFKYPTWISRLTDTSCEGFFLPKTPEEIWDRANTVSHNCMYGYSDRIREGTYLLIHYSKDGVHLDIGLTVYDNLPVLDQICGPHNTQPAPEHKKMVLEFLESCKFELGYRGEDDI
jgi:hypothetical protein